MLWDASIQKFWQNLLLVVSRHWKVTSEGIEVNRRPRTHRSRTSSLSIRGISLKQKLPVWADWLLFVWGERKNINSFASLKKVQWPKIFEEHSRQSLWEVQRSILHNSFDSLYHLSLHQRASVISIIFSIIIIIFIIITIITINYFRNIRNKPRWNGSGSFSWKSLKRIWFAFWKMHNECSRKI